MNMINQILKNPVQNADELAITRLLVFPFWSHIEIGCFWSLMSLKHKLFVKPSYNNIKQVSAKPIIICQRNGLKKTTVGPGH